MTSQKYRRLSVTLKSSLVLGCLGGVFIGGCSTSEAPITGEVGTVSFALSDGVGSHFRLRIYDGPVARDGSGMQLFDTACVQATSTTYQLANIPVGNDHTVYFQGYSDAACSEAGLVETGLRGGIRIAINESPYHYLPIYPVQAVVALPEELNISGSTARKVEFCSEDSDCSSDGKQICYTGLVDEFWCVPVCSQDSDCNALHPQATCDTQDNFCKIHNPYPLNLSEPRALGAAFTMGNGDVVFVAGFSRVGADGALRPGRYLLEGFSRDRGIFTDIEAEGVDQWAGGKFGSALLGGRLIAMVGGLKSLKLEWDGNELTSDTTNWSESLSGDVIIVDPQAGKATKATIPLRGIGAPAVVALSARQFLVAGGVVFDGAFRATNDAWVCDVDDEGVPTCQSTGHLKVARFGAAARCLNDSCNQVLVFGGTGAGALAERYDVAAREFVPLVSEGLPERVFDPVLCPQGPLVLLGGSRDPGVPGTLLPATLELDGDRLVGTPAQLVSGAATTLLGTTVASGGQAGCYSFGGLMADEGASAHVSLFNNDKLDQPGQSLVTPRFGAVSARVGSGPLGGFILVGGGLALPSEPGVPTLVNGVEVLSP